MAAVQPCRVLLHLGSCPWIMWWQKGLQGYQVLPHLLTVARSYVCGVPTMGAKPQHKLRFSYVAPGCGTVSYACASGTMLVLG